MITEQLKRIEDKVDLAATEAARAAVKAERAADVGQEALNGVNRMVPRVDKLEQRASFWGAVAALIVTIGSNFVGCVQ